MSSRISHSRGPIYHQLLHHGSLLHFFPCMEHLLSTSSISTTTGSTKTSKETTFKTFWHAKWVPVLLYMAVVVPGNYSHRQQLMVGWEHRSIYQTSGVLLHTARCLGQSLYCSVSLLDRGSIKKEQHQKAVCIAIDCSSCRTRNTIILSLLLDFVGSDCIYRSFYIHGGQAKLFPDNHTTLRCYIRTGPVVSDVSTLYFESKQISTLCCVRHFRCTRPCLLGCWLHGSLHESDGGSGFYRLLAHSFTLGLCYARHSVLGWTLNRHMGCCKTQTEIWRLSG